MLKNLPAKNVNFFNMPTFSVFCRLTTLPDFTLLNLLSQAVNVTCLFVSSYLVISDLLFYLKNP